MRSVAKTTPIADPYTKTQTLAEVAENTGLSKRDVASVVEELSNVIERHIKKRACGKFTMPGLFKIQTTRKPVKLGYFILFDNRGKGSIGNRKQNTKKQGRNY